jgi:4-hydroxy-2-oxoheptanedioate aldolase
MLPAAAGGSRTPRMRHVHQLRAALGGPGPVLGFWASIPTPLTAEAAAATGAGYVVVDQQHGAAGPAEIMAMLQAVQGAGATPLVRVARNDPWVIGNALDLGAIGVIVPMVDDAAQAARAVAACRYAPEGERSIGVLRAGVPDPADPGTPGAVPLCLVMVETRAGLERVEEIADTPGLDGIYVGPSDLALSFGLEPTVRLEHPPVLDGIERVRAVCARKGLVCGLHCLAAEDAARFADAGFGLLTVGGDLQYLRTALAAALATARAR